MILLPPHAKLTVSINLADDRAPRKNRSAGYHNMDRLPFAYERGSFLTSGVRQQNVDRFSI